MARILCSRRYFGAEIRILACITCAWLILTHLINVGHFVKRKSIKTNAIHRVIQSFQLHDIHISEASNIGDGDFDHMQTENEQVCQVPSLTLTADASRHAFHAVPPLVCKGNSLFYMHNGVLTLNETVLGGRKLRLCQYHVIDWFSDVSYIYSNTYVRNETPFDMTPNHDFYRVKCFLEESDNETDSDSNSHSNANANYDVYTSYSEEENSEDVLSIASDDYANHGNEDYLYDPLEYGISDFDQFIAHVAPREEVLTRFKSSKHMKSSLRLDVLIIVLDSMSHLSYQRKLPKTYSYLKDVLHSVILDGYNIVGDATVAAMLPLLTGHTQAELPETGVNKENSSYVDTLPLIWKKFKDCGYVTLYAEDQPKISTFNLRLNGFKKKPVDHYMRPFWQAVWDSSTKQESERFCLGPRADHVYILEYVKDFYLHYKSSSKFALVFFNQLTHNNNNDPGEYMDEDLLNLLQFLKFRNIFDNTLLVVMGDHGSRYGEVRATTQGKLEERLPLMSLHFPQWFQTKYPELHKNLKENRKKLTTPFDVHETLLDLIDIKRAGHPVEANDRGISLLKTIPLNRTCRSAGIDMHWCSCMQTKAVQTRDPKVVSAADVMIKNLNRAVHNFRHFCEKLHLKGIKNAQLLFPNERVLSFVETVDENQVEANFASQYNLDIYHLLLTIETSPNEGLYEGTVQVNVTGGHQSLTSDISRINKYGDEPSCIAKNHPHLRKFCFCKKQFKH